MMQALFFKSFGDDSKEEIGPFPKPDGSIPGRILIKVTAVALNPVDVARRAGKLPSFVVPPLPIVHGYDFCGIAQEDGKRFKKGDTVFGCVNMLEQGVCAEYASVNELQCALKPDNISDIEAASVPIAAITDLIAFEAAGLRAENDNSAIRVLFLGGAGGLGTLAIQILKNYFKVGFVATTASPGNKTDLCKSLGADLVINYKADPHFDEISKTLEKPFDIIIHGYGPAKPVARKELIAKGGVVIGLGGKAGVVTAAAIKQMADGVHAKLPLMFSFLVNTAIGIMIADNCLFTGASTRRMFARFGATYKVVTATTIDPNSLDLLAELMATEQMKPVIAKVFSLQDSKDAVRLVDQGSAAGKVCITMV